MEAKYVSWNLRTWIRPSRHRECRQTMQRYIREKPIPNNEWEPCNTVRNFGAKSKNIRLAFFSAD